MILGFTGSQTIPHMGLYHLFDRLEMLCDKYRPDEIVTGACIGYDAEIQIWFSHNCPEIRRTVVVPANRSKVDIRCLSDSAAIFVYMPDGTNYRDRNKRLVSLSDQVTGFWTGKRVHSGTFMTLNLSNRANKLDIHDIFGVAPITDEEAQYLYVHGEPT